MRISHYIEHTYAQFLWCRREPWGSVQGGARVGNPLLPSQLHRSTTELIVFCRTLGSVWAVNKLHDIHLSDATVLIEPFRLFCVREVWRQQFVQLIDGMPHVVPVTKGIRTSLRPAAIANIFVALDNFIEIAWQPALGREHVDLKGQAATAW